MNLPPVRTFALTVLGTAVACGGKPPAPVPSASPSASSEAAGGLSRDARAAYDAARPYVRAGDHASAAREFARAVEIAPDFTEGWYNLGAATSHLAVEAAGRGEDGEALRLIREAIDQKRRAQGLIDAGTWWIYDAGQQAVVKSDLENALRDVDAVLADEPGLLTALRLQAGRPQ